MGQYIHDNLFLAIFLGVFLWILLKWKRTRQWRLPPGPLGWPVIGNLPILFQSPGSSNDRYYYTQCANKYGDIYRLQLGPQMMYVLCNIDYVREVLAHTDVQGRSPGVAYTKVFGSEAKENEIKDNDLPELFVPRGGRSHFEKKLSGGVVRGVRNKLLFKRASNVVAKGEWKRPPQSSVDGPAGVDYISNRLQLQKGLILSSGQEWRVMRHFIASVFRETGVGKGVFEQKIMSETNRLMNKIDVLLDKPCWSLQQLFYLSVSNITCGVAFGQQYKYEDVRFKSVVEIMESYSEAMGPSAIVLTSNVLSSLPFGPGKRLKRHLGKFKNFLDQVIEQHSKTLRTDDIATNFVDGFLKEMHEVTENNHFNRGNLVTCCLELFFAGTETTSATLSYAILILATHPHVQQQCQSELDSVLEEGGIPSYADRSKFPYLQAFILETMRLSNIAPLGVAHQVERDLEFFGYDFPKDTLVVVNFGSILMNESVFPNPHQFKPERYLQNGRFKANPDIIPFSIGRRACIGEQLARMELFLFLTCLLKRFSFKAPEGVEMPSFLEGQSGGTRSPLPYAVVISKRTKRCQNN